MRRGTTVVTGVGAAAGSQACAAMLAVEASRNGDAALLLEIDPPKVRRPAVLASAQARDLEERIARGVPEASPAARGRICCAALPPGDDGLAAAGAAVREAGDDIACVVWARPAAFRAAIEDPGLAPKGALLRSDLDRDRAVTALLVRDLLGRGIAVRVFKRAPEWLSSRRAIAGAPGGGKAPGAVSSLLVRLGGERGQAMPAALGAIAILLICVLLVVSLAGALTGKGRAQRTVDLVAVSAVRSMRDDLPRLLSPAVLPSGAPNPQHMPKSLYLQRARAAALRIARANGVRPVLVRVTFPDRDSFAPVQARATVSIGVDGAGVGDAAEAVPLAAEVDGHPAGGPAGEALETSKVTATAEAAAPVTATGGLPAIATGGGYGGPLEYRTGEGMRPDVAAAFDEMSLAAAADGITLTVVSGFRSDAEQAALFAAHPDPTWVAPPGHSLHRCATELDLGPSGAYSWLAANASRFGFVQRYS